MMLNRSRSEAATPAMASESAIGRGGERLGTPTIDLVVSSIGGSGRMVPVGLNDSCMKIGREATTKKNI